ncbi:MAG: DUF3320 domain-containing protein [Oligosphaeraceae bacterium]
MATTDTPQLAGRIGRWSQRLLDLSLRNRLLNARDGKWLIPLAIRDIARLEDTLAAKATLAFRPLQPDDATPPAPRPHGRQPVLSPSRTPIRQERDEATPDLPDDVCPDLPGEQLVLPLGDSQRPSETAPIPPGDQLPDPPDDLLATSPRLTSPRQERDQTDADTRGDQLLVPLTAGELNRRLVALARQSRTDLEEGGVNTLFLAIGFLQWLVPGQPKPHRAPLLLMPVRLTRQTPTRTHALTRLDEETVVNETLLELLRSQFRIAIPGVSPLPTDASGVDIPCVLQLFRQAIAHLPGWDILEEAALGLFSFGKFVMWTDLTSRADELARNPLVRHLMTGEGLFDDGIQVFPPEELERHLNPAELFCPLSADASQLNAVLTSALGKSFVLHGPPGTGKSQTITNLIAHNLALGRRVLFVSEKKAALDVVHRRLSAIGLRPFCLELHSSKAGRAEVLRQFAEALAVPDQHEPQDWKRLTDELAAQRDALSAYVTALHRTYPNGLSAWQCLNGDLDTPDIPNGILPPGLTEQSAETLARQRRAAAALVQAWQATSTQSLRQLACVSTQPWSPQLERTLADVATALADALADVLRRAAALTQAAGLASLPASLPLAACVRLATALLDCRRPDGTPIPLPPGQAASATWRQDGDALRQHAQRHSQLAQLRQTLAPYDLDALLLVTPDALERQLADLRQTFFLLRPFRRRALLANLRHLTRPGAPPLTVPTLETILPAIRQLQQLTAQTRSDAPRAAALLGCATQDLPNRDWSHTDQDQQAIGHLLDTLDALRQATHATAAQRRDWGAALASALDNPDTAAALLDAAQLLPPAWQTLQNAHDRASGLLDDAVLDQLPLSEAADTLRQLPEHLRDLRAVLRLRQAHQDAHDAGLDRAADALLAGQLEPHWLDEDFARLHRHAMLEELLAHEPALATFSGPAQNRRIRDFASLDERYTALTRKLLAARLAARLPRRRNGPCPEGSELGILKRECEKKTRHKPVRQLLAELPTLAGLLKPCFLMSPMSVAQYLPPDAAPFDLIVFDEASQIPVWDAIGAIARGRQLIVVGDPKQMPPTAFFQKGDPSGNDDAPDDEDAIEDLESILDECLAAGLHSTQLTWHYRSRHESLIAFSNLNYYGGNLMVFPAARRSDRLGVSLRLVPNATYDRRASRTNRREAEALVDFIFQSLADTPETAWRSLGVVTFSQAQRDLIDDLVEQRRRQHPEADAFFADDTDEPFFVKNLENVQGDERDVILFSVGYANDPDGRLAMNFGPLNRQGGERRLNVAITRAKEQVVVFSSIRADQLDLSRSSALGVAHLRQFLNFAEHGGMTTTAAAAADTQPDDAPATALADAIADFLRRQGLPVERRSACSGCLLDPVIPNPDRPGDYLLAIEGDGPDYAAQRTVRDREHLRDAVLTQLGWRLFRAWSADWSLDRANAEQHLLDAIHHAQAQSQRRLTDAIHDPATSPHRLPDATDGHGACFAPRTSTTPDGDRDARLLTASPIRDVTPSPNASDRPSPGDTPRALAAATRPGASADRPSPGDTPRALAADDANHTEGRCGDAADLASDDDTPRALAADDPSDATLTELPVTLPPPVQHYHPWGGHAPAGIPITTPEAQPYLRDQLADIIRLEAPICETLLRRRILRAWGLSRAGRAINEAITNALPHDVLRTNLGTGTVFWNHDQTPDTYTGCRAPASDADRRDLADIPPEELANVMRETLRDLGLCPQETLYRETLRFLGFTALTAKQRHYLDFAHQHLLKR